MSTNHKFKAGKLRAAKKAVDTAVATAQSGGDNTAAISEKELDLHQLPDQVRDKFEKKANRAIVDIARTILADLQSSEAAKSRSRKKQGKKNDADAMPELDRFELSAYPYQETIGRAVYERIKLQLQSELLKVQRWVIENNLKMIVMFEGHDAAGKGGSIKRFMEHLNPRHVRVVALGVPTEKEKTQWYFQRYIEHLPTGGEMVFLR